MYKNEGVLHIKLKQKTKFACQYLCNNAVGQVIPFCGHAVVPSSEAHRVNPRLEIRLLRRKVDERLKASATDVASSQLHHRGQQRLDEDFLAYWHR